MDCHYAVGADQLSSGQRFEVRERRGQAEGVGFGVVEVVHPNERLLPFGGPPGDVTPCL